MMGIGSGYGGPSAALMPRLAGLPEIGGRHAVAQHAWHGLESQVIHLDGFRIYPKGKEPYGNDIVGLHTRDFGANWVATLIDTWVLHDTAKEVAPALWTPYLPIDMTPPPQKVLDGMAGCHLPLVFSKWGVEELAKIGVESMYIPLGVEPNTFRILPDDAVAHFKQTAMQGADHLTVMVAANSAFPSRKAFEVNIPAWATFAKDKPGARLYLHTNPSVMDGGLDIAALCAELGILDKVMFPSRYQYKMGYPPHFLALVYNAADVLLAASRGEGFGIPIVEGQACGTPVITTNFSSMPELVRWGHAVGYVARDRTYLNSWQVIPDEEEIVFLLNELYAEWEADGRQKNADKRAATQDAIHAEYGWDVLVRDFWRPLARRIAKEAPELDERFRIAVPEPMVWRPPVAVPEVNGLHKLGVTRVETKG
jgi:glycosyltransferase involved in cell wall biosynthesis